MRLPELTPLWAEESSVDAVRAKAPGRPYLKLQKICCERGGRLLIRDLSFELEAGTGIRLLGANGSGKTTLLRVIAGLSQRYSGDIEWLGGRAHVLGSSLYEHLLYFSHAPGVKDSLTPLENLQWWQRLHLSLIHI